jgi:hypothetical protein
LNTFPSLTFSTPRIRCSNCTYHTDPVSNSLSRKVASKLGPNHATVSMGTSYLSPDHSGFVWFATRSHCVADFKRIEKALRQPIQLTQIKVTSGPQVTLNPGYPLRITQET